MTEKQLKERKSRFKKIDTELKKLFPNPKIALNYTTTFELLIAVMMSAQSTDKQINKVTKTLFKKYTSIEDYANVSQEQLEKDIYGTGFYRNKAKNVRATAKIILEKFNGEVPDTMEELLTLPGVARKTANIVLGNAFNKVEGIAVDTHVRRFAVTHNLTNETTNTEKIEQDLMQIIPKEDWFTFTYRAIEYGRNYCSARNHDHEHCPLVKINLDKPTT